MSERQRFTEAHSSMWHTWWSGVDCHGAADQADVQTASLVDQAGDGGFVRGEEVLQSNLLGPLAALIHNDAVKERRDELSCFVTPLTFTDFLIGLDISSIGSVIIIIAINWRVIHFKKAASFETTSFGWVGQHYLKLPVQFHCSSTASIPLLPLARPKLC